MRPKTFQWMKKCIYIIDDKAVALKSENRRTMEANKYSKTDNEYAIACACIALLAYNNTKKAF